MQESECVAQIFAAQGLYTIKIGIAKHVVLPLGLIRARKTVDRGRRAHHGVQQEDEEQHRGSRHEADGLRYRHGGGGICDRQVVAVSCAQRIFPGLPKIVGRQ